MKLKDSNPILPSHSPLLHTITRASWFRRHALLSAAEHHTLSALWCSSPSHSLLVATLM